MADREKKGWYLRFDCCGGGGGVLILVCTSHSDPFPESRTGSHPLRVRTGSGPKLPFPRSYSSQLSDGNRLTAFGCLGVDFADDNVMNNFQMLS